MVLWAGIDEAGYGPRLGPLVVTGTAFSMPGQPAEGVLWDLLRDAVAPRARGSDGRLIVNDSKLVYSGPARFRRLEESVLAFLRAGTGKGVQQAGELFSLLLAGASDRLDTGPWFDRAGDLPLPAESHSSAVESKAAALGQALSSAQVRVLALRSAVVFPAEFNRIVAHTRNKAYLLFQKCGLLLQELWRMAGQDESYVLVDRHGGRMRYRKLLHDVFPGCRCDILSEESGSSVYRVQDGPKRMVIAFKEGGDGRAVPTALASMTSKYVRELYMRAFNEYWQQRLAGLKPTSGYWVDAGRFLQAIEPMLHADNTDLSVLIRSC